MTEKHDIIPQRTNANRHTERGMRLLEKSIAEDGWIGAVTVAANGETFDGSARVETTAANGMLEDAIVVQTDGSRPVVVVRADIPTADDPRAKRLGVGANQIAAENLSWDSSVLASLVTEIDLTALFQPDELAAILADVETPEEGAGGDDFDATPEDGPTRTQPGDLWIIGGVHRLIVGDCTDPAVVERLMQGERASALVTDPPYAVAYVDKARDMHQRGYGHSRAKSSAAIEGDEINDEQAAEIWRGAFWAALELATTDHAAWYVWHAPGRATLLLLNVMADLKMLHHQTIIWVKNNFVIGRSDYQWQHEPCWYGWKQGNRPPFYGAKNQTTVWEVGRDLDPEHPTQKPIALYEPGILNHTKAGDIIYDCFAGSGPALVAAHRHNRRAYLAEKMPARADVILRRAEAEGLTVERAADG
jgi:DNA modification methylase